MKQTGITRKVDKFGRIVLPKELRDNNDLEGENFEIFVEENDIILKKYERSCIFCDTANDLIEIDGKMVCRDHLKKIMKKYSEEL